MRNSAAFRLVSYMCAYFMPAVLMRLVPAADYPLCGAIVLLALPACLAAVQIEKAGLRLLISLLPYCALTLFSSLSSVITAGIPLVCCSIYLAFGRFYGEAWRCLRIFKPVAAAVTVVSAYTLLSYSPNLTDDGWRVSYIACIAFAAGFFFFGFLSLRTLRAGNIRSARWQGGIIGWYLAAILAGAVLGVLLTLIAPYLSSVFAALIYPIMLLISLITKLLGTLLAPFKEFEADFAPTPEPTPDASASPAEPEPVHPGSLPEDAGFAPLVDLKSINWTAVAIALIAAVVLSALIIRLLRAKKHERTFLDDTSPERGETLPAQRPRLFTRLRRRSARTEKTNADAIRGIYRRYLDFLRIRGITRSSADTSGDISGLSRPVLYGETDEALRALYIKARYSAQEITAEDVAAAGEALARLVNSEKNT